MSVNYHARHQTNNHFDKFDDNLKYFIFLPNKIYGL